MAAGDAQRIWYPELVEALRSQWRPEMTFEPLVALRDELDAMLQQIRLERHIPPAVIRCPECGRRSPAPEAHLSVRALILALLRLEVAAPEPIYALEKSWARYRKQHGLDLYGKAVDPEAAPAAGCVHKRTKG